MLQKLPTEKAIRHDNGFDRRTGVIGDWFWGKNWITIHCESHSKGHKVSSLGCWVAFPNRESFSAVEVPANDCGNIFCRFEHFQFHAIQCNWTQPQRWFPSPLFPVVNPAVKQDKRCPHSYNCAGSVDVVGFQWQAGLVFGEFEYVGIGIAGSFQERAGSCKFAYPTSCTQPMASSQGIDHQGRRTQSRYVSVNLK